VSVCGWKGRVIGESRIMQIKGKRISGSLLSGIILALAVIGFGIGTSVPMPPNATVIVDENEKVYFAPPFFEDNGLIIPLDYKRDIARNVRERYKPDKTCRDQGYFVQDTGPLLWKYLKELGIIRSRKRWNEDSSWNW